ncbi:hypothetical protein BigBertha_96 [Bacillus phage BigBertha]|uniref:Uncharacterized protein n=1 Tax=Bacillus phage BigBertha TaxID=1406781 RepID=U5PRW1_9CAUD|nr:hypothetical protein BigBertha_96 [Bacillus phage BigBertha]AGY46604.1 hypothetical protein BigBertha_96 [Bacillus phage BigBertha]
MNTPQGTQINPKYVLLEQSQTVHTLTDEVIKLRAYTAQLEEENSQLKATIQAREESEVDHKNE